MRGVVSAGFSTTVFPQASAGAIFQLAISSGKFQGMIWPTTPSGRAVMPGTAYSSLSAQPGVVEEVGRGQRHVDVARLADRLAAVDRLEHRELAGAVRQQAREAEEVLGPRPPGQVAPAAFVGAPRGRHGVVDVPGAGLGHLGQVVARGRLDGGEGLSLSGLPLDPVDHQAVPGSDRDHVARLQRRDVVGEPAGQVGGAGVGVAVWRRGHLSPPGGRGCARSGRSAGTGAAARCR